MTKRGVPYTSYLAIAVLLSLLAALAPALAATGPFLPGDEETVRQQVIALANNFPPTHYAGDGADVCLVIDAAPNGTLSYRLFKNAGVIEVTPSPYSTYCANDIYDRGPEDLVIQYVDYDSFLDHYRDPSCQNFKESGDGEDFYYLPSEFVQQGGTPVCNALFQERYCPAVKQCLSAKEMRLSGLGCCVERRVFEIPGIFSNMYFLIGLAVLLAIIFIITMVTHGHQELATQQEERQRVTRELLVYIDRALALGYPPNEVESHLHELGWEREALDVAFGEVLKRWLVKEGKEESKNRI